MTNINLPLLQKNQLSLAMQVRKICEKHKIPYFIIAGTLLGAVRHKGFIPWDDDLDIGMLRKDYDRFIELAQTELGDAYFVQNYKTDQHMPFPFTKLRINGTVMREIISKNCKWNNGIFIDIFPFDGVPDNNLIRLIHKNLIKLTIFLLMTKCGFCLINEKSSKIIESAFKGIQYFTQRLLPHKALTKTLDILITMFSKKATRFVWASGGSYGYKRETIPRKWVEKTKSIIFCNTKFNCPSSWKEYLHHLYGDYMKLPPIESRLNRHGIVELKFKDLP